MTGVLADVNARQEPPEKKDSRVPAEPRPGLAMLIVALVGQSGARSRVIGEVVLIDDAGFGTRTRSAARSPPRT